jgi:hypothetical protein
LIGALPWSAQRRGLIGECNGGMPTHDIDVTTKQFLKDLAFTAGAALLTGGTVSLVAAAVILLLAR